MRRSVMIRARLDQIKELDEVDTGRGSGAMESVSWIERDSLRSKLHFGDGSYIIGLNHDFLYINPHTPISNRRGGFTLIELLVVITILTILVSITAASMSWSAQKDRVPQAANEVASFIMGGRDRAIHNRKIAGVRLILDQNGPVNQMGNPCTASSLLYVGQLKPVYGTLAIDMNDGQTIIPWSTGPDGLVGAGGIDDDGMGVDDNMNGQIDEPSEQDNHTDELGNGDDVDGSSQFTTLESLGLIKDGTQITISQGGSSSLSFRIQKVGANWQLTAPVSWRNSQNVASFVDFEYELTLEPAVLPDQAPRELPKGVCIDLEASLMANGLPSTWHDPGTRSYLTMDIIFSPRGTGTGTWAGFGLCNLVVAEQSDVEITEYPNPAEAFYRLQYRKKAGQERCVSVNPTTGSAIVSSLNLDDSDGDDVPDDPFQWAETGKPAK